MPAPPFSGFSWSFRDLLRIDGGVGGNTRKSRCDLDCWRAQHEDDSDGPDTNGNGIPDMPDPAWEVGHPYETCKYDNLVECYYSGGYWPSGDTTFNDEEWDAFTLALYLDILKRSQEDGGFWTHEWDGTEGAETKFWLPFHTQGYFARKGYDTPFWNGSEVEAVYTGNVCFENGSCYDRNDVNYIAQGMWSAAAHEGPLGIPGALGAANAWKWVKYQHLASPSVNYWAVQGAIIYNRYRWP